MEVFSECPLKPAPSFIAPASVAPSNACTTTRCAFYLTSIDNRTGKVVGGACSIPMFASALTQIAQTVQMKAAGAKSPPPPPPPPAS